MYDSAFQNVPGTVMDYVEIHGSGIQTEILYKN